VGPGPPAPTKVGASRDRQHFLVILPFWTENENGRQKNPYYLAHVAGNWIQLISRDSVSVAKSDVCLRLPTAFATVWTAAIFAMGSLRAGKARVVQTQS